MSDPDLTCPTCEGAGRAPVYHEGGPTVARFPCIPCHGAGRRPPTLAEYDARVAERERALDVLNELWAEFILTSVRDVDSGRPLRFAVIRESLWERAGNVLLDFSPGPDTARMRDRIDALGNPVLHDPNRLETP